MENVETTILKNLIFNDEYSRKVLPFINKEYFESYHEKVIFEETEKFIVQYNNLPTKEAIIIDKGKAVWHGTLKDLQKDTKTRDKYLAI